MLTRVWAALRPVVLWSYRRGSWQYDVIVAAILAFIFLTPAEFFGDQPRPPAIQEVQRLSASGGQSVYWVDAAAVGEVAPDEVADRIETLLQKRHEQRVRVLEARPEKGPDGTVSAYLVYAGE
ncbi:MAG: hypothetical protein GC160_17110 [Acidobacteria bacterium]|nr:hypothetical protein [Acidobacteriota bacterium]